jgi:Zn-dependent peptidase ImmA (M78 family)
MVAILMLVPNPVTEGLNGARAVRRELGYDPLQPIDPSVVARRLGLLVVRRPLRAAALWGMHLYDEAVDDHLILINSSQQAFRQRFTLAHEIGHARFDRVTIVESLDRADSAPEEKRANAFASELLMPEAAVKKWLPERPWGEDIDEIARLAIHFGLSLEATLWKLFNAALIEDVEKLRDKRASLAPDLRAALRTGGDGTTEYPERYTELVKAGVDRGLVSRGRAAELLATEEDF